MSFYIKDVAVRKAACKNWAWSLVIGIIIALSGIAGLLYAGIATLTSVFVFGILEIIVGVSLIAHAYSVKTAQQVLFNFILGILCIVAGILLIVYPEAAALSLTMLIAVLLIVGGIARIIASFTMKFEHWGWLLLNGVLGIILGVLIINQWPISALWVIGTFVSLDILFTGLTYMALGMRAKRVCQAKTEADIYSA